MERKQFKFPKNISKIFLKKDNLLILLLCGILLLVIAIPVDTKEKQANKEENVQEEPMITEGNQAIENYTQYLETQLEEILSLIENAGKIRVMLTLEDGGERVIEKDTESTSESVDEEDSAGGSRTSNSSSVKEVTIYDQNSENGNPYIAKEKSPVIAGVLVVAQGGDNAVVVRNITEAVQALFDIDTHKIKVIKGN